MITIKDIAKMAGVSIGTVDRVLHGRGRFSLETAERIRNIVKETGYSTNVLARNLSLAKTNTIAVLIPKVTQDCGYWQLVFNGIQEHARDLTRYKVSVCFYEYDRYSKESFDTIARKVKDLSPDGILLAPVNPTFAIPFIRTLPENIPFVYVDSTLPDTAPLSVVAQDSFQSGILAAKLMCLSIREPGTVAVVRIHPNNFHIKSRADGFIRGLEGNPSLSTKVIDVDGFNTQDLLIEKITHVVNTDSLLRGIFVTNAYAHFVAECVSKSSKQVKVIGYDTIPANIPFVRSGAIDFIISQSPERQGREALNALYRYLVLQERCEQHICVPIDIVTKENVDYYIAQEN